MKSERRVEFVPDERHGKNRQQWSIYCCNVLAFLAPHGTRASEKAGCGNPLSEINRVLDVVSAVNRLSKKFQHALQAKEGAQHQTTASTWMADEGP